MARPSSSGATTSRARSRDEAPRRRARRLGRAPLLRAGARARPRARAPAGGRVAALRDGRALRALHLPGVGTVAPAGRAARLAVASGADRAAAAAAVGRLLPAAARRDGVDPADRDRGRRRRARRLAHARGAAPPRARQPADLRLRLLLRRAPPHRGAHLDGAPRAGGGAVGRGAFARRVARAPPRASFRRDERARRLAARTAALALRALLPLRRRLQARRERLRVGERLHAP